MNPAGPPTSKGSPETRKNARPTQFSENLCEHGIAICSMVYACLQAAQCVGLATIIILFICSSLEKVQNIVVSVSVCLLAYLKNHTAELYQFLCTFSVVFSVLSPTNSMWYIMYFWFCGWRHVFTLCYGALCVFIIGKSKNSQNHCINYNQILLNDKDQQVHIVGCAPGAKSGYLWLPYLAVGGDITAAKHLIQRPSANRGCYQILMVKHVVPGEQGA